MIAAIVAVAAVAIVAIAAVAHAYAQALARTDRAATAEVNAARAEGAAADWQASADTADRLRRSETERADALDEELAHADQDRADHPDVAARRRVLSRWRRAARTAAAAPEGGDGAGPVSDPAAADIEP